MIHISRALSVWLERKDFTPSQIEKIKKGLRKHHGASNLAPDDLKDKKGINVPKAN